MKKILNIFLKTIAGIILAFSLTTLFLFILKTPSHTLSERATWEFGQQHLPQVEILDNSVTITNLRDFDWTKEGEEEKYIDISFKLTQIESLEVGESHFHVREGIGHVFLVFNLDDGRNFALSVETRREEGEKFTVFKGLTFDYELMYIFATKEDLISLREKREERIYVYPVNTDAEKAQEIFKLVAERVNSIHETPEFYHIIFKNCTNQITKEVEKISDKTFPLYEKTIAPGYAGRALHEMGILDVDYEKAYEEVREDYLIKF